MKLLFPFELVEREVLIKRESELKLLFLFVLGEGQVSIKREGIISSEAVLKQSGLKVPQARSVSEAV